MMFKSIFVIVFVALSLYATPMTKFQSVTPNQATLLQQGDAKLFCPSCGMNLVMFYKTNHAAKINGVEHQFCSIHCLTNEIENNHLPLTDIRVVDADSLQFIDATKAFYVVGSDVKGTMSMVSKYAFSTEEAAKAFAAKHGGEVRNFEQTYALVKASLPKENTMIGKKQKKMAQKGKMIVEKLCVENKIKPAFSVAEAKAQVLQSGACEKLNGKQLQAVGLYIANKTTIDGTNTATLHVPQHAKCPVCGMFVSKYPKWAAKLSMAQKVYYFDGVKDMMKFYCDPKAYHITPATIDTMEVTDYYTLKTLPAKTAAYVYGSDVYGPMGHEIIPFKDRNSANNFVKDHGGKVLTFDAITCKLLTTLDH